MEDGLAGFLMGLLLGVFCTGITVSSYGDNWWQGQIRQRGYSEYCQDDGSWAWKGECNDK